MYHGDLLTAAAYGGVLMGAGLGLVLRGGATTVSYTHLDVYKRQMYGWGASVCSGQPW